MTEPNEPSYYLVATARTERFAPRPQVTLSPVQPTLNQAREVTRDGLAGGVILAVWPDGTITAVEAVSFEASKTGKSARIMTATYETVPEAGTLTPVAKLVSRPVQGVGLGD